MPTGVELYGQTTGLDSTTLGRIQTGFNEIRAIEGWEDFRIPSYVWDWVDQTERDMLLAFTQHSLWVHRDGVDLPADVPKTAHFVFLYVLFLWVEWWYDIPNEMRIEIGSQGLLDKLQTDWGFAEWAFYEDDVYSFHYIATVDPDGYEGFDGYIHHPYHAGWETDAYKLSAFEIYMYHDLAGWSYMYADVGYGGDYIEYWADVDGGQWYRYRDNLYASDIRIADYLGAGWDDRGIPAEGWPEWVAIFANGEHEVLSGRASYKSFGLMDGEVSLNVALDVGDTLTVARGDTPLLTGIVTNVRADLVEGTYAHEIADPVTSQSGEVEYTSGNAITAMQDAIEACGGTFETAMDTEETVFYPGSPVDAWQFFRAVSYAVGGVLQYGRDGVYRLVEGGSGHSVTDSMVIGDDRPTIEERKDYANRVAASIDQEWRTPAVEPTNDIFSGGGATANITRLGEQITSQSVGYGDSTSIENSYSYDENNYLVYKKIEEDGEDYARLTEVTFSGISEDGNDYTVTEEETFYTKMMVPDGIGGLKSETVPEEKTTKTFVVDLNGVASVEEIYENRWPSWIGAFPFIPDPDSWLDLFPQTKWYGVIVLKPSSGPLEGYTSAKQYNYVHNGFKMDGGNIVPTVGWVQAKCASKSWSVPKLEVYAPEDTHEVHILAKAEDPDAIDALGEHEYECQAVSLDTETGMQAFALGVLFEKGRIRHANVSVANDDYLSGDSVIWRGLEWQIDTVTVDLDRCSDIIEMVTTSTLARLQNSISREPVSWIEDVKNVVTKRTGLYDNVSRGRILSQVGFRRYLVQAEGKATPVEAKALTDDPHLVGGSVLLVRPSGKGQPWTLLSLSKEQEILMPATGEAKVTPDTRPAPPELVSFTAEAYQIPIFSSAVLEWEFSGDTGLHEVGVEIDPGDDREVITVLGNNAKFVPVLPNTEIIYETLGDYWPVARPFYTSVTGNRIYGEPVNLAEQLNVGGPVITGLSKGAGDIVFAVEHPLLLTTNLFFSLEQGFTLMIDHGDGTGWLEYELEEENDGTGVFAQDYTWYQTGSKTVTAKIVIKQGWNIIWESEEVTLDIVVENNPGASGGIVTIGPKDYVVLPVGGDFLFDGAVAELFNPLGTPTTEHGTYTRLRRNSEEPTYGVGGQWMNGLSISFNLHAGETIRADSSTNLYLSTGRHFWPTLACGNGSPTEYLGGYYDSFTRTIWRIGFYEYNGSLRMWSGTLGGKLSSWHWWHGYWSYYVLMPIPSGPWNMNIRLEKEDSVPLSASTSLRLYIDGTYVRNVGYGHVAWEEPFPWLSDFSVRNVPPTWSGRGWTGIGKDKYRDLSITGNVQVFVPQQLVEADPSIIPGGSCEFITWPPVYE
ncbi:MAG: hypothetical protein WDA41_07560 [Candidatus Neomarinimicrobiota bacterium]